MTITLTTGTILMEAIKNDTHDMTVRLAYADWLEETGDNSGINLATFIRKCIASGDINAQEEFWDYNSSTIRDTRLDSFTDTVVASLDHIWKLPNGWQVTCYEPLHQQRVDRVKKQIKEIGPYPGPGSALTVNGFIANVGCTLTEWLKHGHIIASTHPLEWVELVGRQASINGLGPYGWRCKNDGELVCDLPVDIWSKLQDGEKDCRGNEGYCWYDTVEEANHDLSRACILSARSRGK